MKLMPSYFDTILTWFDLYDNGNTISNSVDFLSNDQKEILFENLNKDSTQIS